MFFFSATAFNFFFRSLVGRADTVVIVGFAFFSFSCRPSEYNVYAIGDFFKKKTKKNYKHTTKYIKVQTYTGQYESYANALTPDANIQRNPYTHLVLDSLILSHISLIFFLCGSRGVFWKWCYYVLIASIIFIFFMLFSASISCGLNQA